MRRGTTHSLVNLRPGKTTVGFVGSKADAPIETDSVCNVRCSWSIMNPNPVKSKQRAQLNAPLLVSLATTTPITEDQRKKYTTSPNFPESQRIDSNRTATAETNMIAGGVRRRYCSTKTSG